MTRDRVLSQRRRQRAFTLIETLVALGLLLVLVGAVFAFGTNLTASRDRLSTHMRRSQAVRVFLDRLEQDLHTSVALDAGHGAGIVGDESSIRLLSRSVGAMGQSQGIASALGDLQRSEYRWSDSSKTLEASRGAPDGGGAWSAIADDLGYVQWRYHDGNGWVNQYDSGASKRLPVAVEVSIWFVSPLSAEEQAAADAKAAEEANASDEQQSDAPGSILGAMAPPPEPPRGADASASPDDAHRDWPRPDRVRLIIIPDAPDYEYGRNYDDNVDLPASSPTPSDAGGGQ